ncbi:MAG: hypothetical protein K5648_01145 [Erysipelotrichaceae bacterium]|nr:hypothetical protein [Erysipelotrichaceae bacterium]
MKLEEAREFYFEYKGYAFHMGREEPERYDRFRMLEIDEETLKQWDEELLESLFSRLWEEPERIWTRQNHILQIIRRKHCDTERYLNRLSEEMEKMTCLDLFQTTLIIENMAGRTEGQKDGGAYVFFACSGPAERMNEAMEALIGRFKTSETDRRFKEAVSRYRNAYRKWRQ